MIDEDISNINSLQDIQDALSRHPELLTVFDVKTKWRSLYYKFNNLKTKGIIDKNIKFPLQRKIRDEKNYHRYAEDEFNTIEKCQEYIDKMGYTSRADFLESGDPTIYRMDKLGFTKELVFKNKRPKYDTSMYDTIEKCQAFVDSHSDIDMIDVLRDSKDPEYHSVYLSIKNHKWSFKIKFTNRNLGRKDLSYLKTLEDVQEFINQHEDIRSERDFRVSYLEEYKKAVSLGVCSDIIYEFRHRKSKDYTKYESVSEIQDLVNTKGYLSMYDFKKGEHNAYIQYIQLRKTDHRNLIFKYVSTGSAYEDRFILSLEMYGITYSTQFRFPEFTKNTGCYRYDFYLPEKNVIIEVHGEQHFGNDPNEFGGALDPVEEQANDKIKYEYAAVTKGIPVVYFTYCKDRYNSFGYFRPVYTDIIELLKDIGYSNLEIIDNFSSEENILSGIQNYVTRFSITSLKELKESNFVYGNRVIAYSLEDKITYYKKENREDD